MLLIKNITNIPITINNYTIDPRSSIKLDIPYESYLRSLEKSGSLSIVEIKSNSADEELPVIIAKRRRKQNNSQSTDKNNLESE